MPTRSLPRPPSRRAFHTALRNVLQRPARVLFSAAALSALSLNAAAQSAPASAAGSGDAALASLADQYFDQYYFPTNPTAATLTGLHDYDTQLEDYSSASIGREDAALKDWLTRFKAVDAATLSEQSQGDLLLLQNSIKSTLLTLDTIKPWQKNPDFYSSAITASAFSIMERRFASPNDRLKLLIAREKLMPKVLDEARANLDNPPAIYTKVALEQLPGDVAFFRGDLPSAFKDADDAALKAQFKNSNEAVIAALKAYGQWIDKTLKSKSRGDYRLGADVYREKLHDDEMVDIPLDRLLAIGMDDLHRNQAEFARVAHELEPDKTPQQVLAELAADHPRPAQLLPAFQATFDDLIGFIKSHGIIDLPSDLRPTLEATPPFMRATTFASMDTPGPYEMKATEAYFNVTPPEASWSKQHTEEFMAQFSYPVISNVVVHEAYPGHYVQLLWQKQVHDRVRKLLGANSNIEGWAHYCEQMMLDEGYGTPGNGAKDERQSKLLRLGQLQDALLRDARYVVSIRLHTGDMSFDQAVDFFVEQGYQSRVVGEVETTRGTSDPMYLYYTLGKLEIMKLRTDLQAREGKDFDLRKFHDDFMLQGTAPIPLIRKAMLHDDSPAL